MFVVKFCLAMQGTKPWISLPKAWGNDMEAGNTVSTGEDREVGRKFLDECFFTHQTFMTTR